MANYLGRNLIEALQSLDERRKRAVGTDEAIKVCRVCYHEKDDKGCPCGRVAWTLLSVVIVELQLAVEAQQREEHLQRTKTNA